MHYCKNRVWKMHDIFTVVACLGAAHCPAAHMGWGWLFVVSHMALPLLLLLLLRLHLRRVWARPAACFAPCYCSIARLGAIALPPRLPGALRAALASTRARWGR